MRKRYHVHIYKIKRKFDVNVLANNSLEARGIALNMMQHLKLKSSTTDCHFIAVDATEEKK